MEKTLLITPLNPILVLRVSFADGSSRNGFIWPTQGQVICPDWEETDKCGNGLHGWLYGEGDFKVADSDLIADPTSLWLAVLVPAYVELNGKVKFEKGEVVCNGNRLVVTNYLRANGCIGPLIGGTVMVGDNGTAIAGSCGTATAGSFGTATAGERGTAITGNYGKATAGESGTATAGYQGKATAGNFGKATAGESGVAVAGERSMATVGNHGTAMAGYHSTATAGDNGTAITGNCGMATAGVEGILLIKYWNGERYRQALGYISETLDINGSTLQPNVPYKVNISGEFMLVWGNNSSL